MNQIHEKMYRVTDTCWGNAKFAGSCSPGIISTGTPAAICMLHEILKVVDFRNLSFKEKYIPLPELVGCQALLWARIALTDPLNPSSASIKTGDKTL